MRLLEQTTKNGKIVRQNLFNDVDGKHFEKMVNYYTGKTESDLLSFAYDEYAENSAVLYAFRAEMKDYDDVFVVSMMLFRDDAKIVLSEIKIND